MPRTTACQQIASMIRGRFMFPYEIQDALVVNHNRMVSESNVTARLRQLRKQGHTVETRRVTGKSVCLYRIPRKKKTSPV